MTNPFVATAQALFAERGLSINGTVYEFAELEFYWHTKEHPDPYVHCHPEQEQYAKWYFHRTTTAATAGYKGGTFKGLDLTLGAKGAYLGILIRSIYHPTTGMISGPCCVVDHILAAYGMDSITTLVGPSAPLDATVTGSTALRLVSAEHKANESIYVGPRIGLNVTKDITYCAKPYRFVRRYSAGKKLKAKRTLTKLAT